MAALPVELVIELMNAVRNTSDSRTAAKTFHTCALVSRTWHAAAIRYVWLDIHLPSLSKAQECIRSIQRYPRNARFTRSLTFNAGTPLRDHTKPEVEHTYESVPYALSTSFPNVQQLVIDNATIPIATLASFFATSSSITSLSIYHWTGSVDPHSESAPPASHLASLQTGISRLTHVTAGAPTGTPCHIYNDSEKTVLSYITSNVSTHLRSFAFTTYFKHYVDQCLESLATQTCNLENLTLEKSATETSILPIVRSNPNLKSINLNGTRATDTVVETLISTCPHITSIDLAFSYITDRAISSLTSPSAPHLTSLDLTNTYISEEVFADYVKEKGGKLRRLILKENRWVTERTLRAIEEFAPGVEVLEVDELIWMGLCQPVGTLELEK
ncbi:hypothetical protein HK097_007796 [Rhizophlyctis rosea]|uniref:F-box domain-containing protein n=1 Tax=Rhizophlyctis rosea TaxID=64517 RepID=A0AAD5SIJ1_9FUNG|nr:hypothetical protein HK097_007796 [Rhizophlyctis rosea]